MTLEFSNYIVDIKGKVVTIKSKQSTDFVNLPKIDLVLNHHTDYDFSNFYIAEYLSFAAEHCTLNGEEYKNVFIEFIQLPDKYYEVNIYTIYKSFRGTITKTIISFTDLLIKGGN